MNKKLKSVEPADRLSELPDSLILNIFEFLPMRDVVRTPILSRRWKKLWTISPCFYFVTNSDDNDKFRNFVNRALLCRRGTRVQKFKVSGIYFDASLYADMDLWVLFAVDNRVEELDIWFQSTDFEERAGYRVPKCLFSCSSLQKLSLICSGLEIKGNVQWNRLKNLKIECIVLKQHDIDQILCGSPLLEVFSLSFLVEESESKFSFRSCSLKKLSIYQTCISSENADTVLTIWAPNLVMLTISGESYFDCFLMNVSSLARADILIHDYYEDNLWEILSQILPAIQHVEGLGLSQSCIEVLGAENIKSSLSPFLNVKFLSLAYCFEELERIVRLVEIFPRLKTLVVEDGSEYVYSKSKVKFKPNPSESFLLELKTVVITWTRHDFFIFPFIKILLKYANKLEKMVFRVKRTEPSNNILLASKKLLKMQRSSPSAKLIFHEY